MGQFDNISNKKLAYQLVMPRLDTGKYYEVLEYKLYIKDLAIKGIGGFCVFGGNANQVELMINELQNIAEVPLIFSADFEFGLPMRLIDDGTSFPHSMAIAKSGKIEHAYKIAEAIAKEAKAIGINWNFAPVVDINSNKKNPIINIRSYGETSDIVSNYATEFIKGTEAHKIVSCIKHFPGHGDTSKDSHLELPVLNMTLDELESLELIPFRKAIANGVKSIMVGHLAVPAIDESGLPASLSHKIITDLLINEIDYKGVIITDALDMNAISENFSSNEIVAKSLSAGADIALMPEKVIEGIEYLIELLENDMELRQQLINSYQKVYNLKRWCGLIPQFALQTSQSKIFLDHQKLALKVALDAIDVRGNYNLIPIDEKINFAGFAYIQRDADLQSASRFFTMLSQATENDCDFAFINDKISNDEIDGYLEGTKDAEIIIFTVFIKSIAYSGTVQPNAEISEILTKIKSNRKAILILFGNPYIDDLVESELLIKTFSDSFASLAAAVVKLTGRESAVDY